MPTNPPNITALPNPPDPNDRSSFNVRAYPWSVAQQTLATEVAAVAANVKGNADEAVAAAVSAASQAGAAAVQAAVAIAAAASAINSPGSSASSTSSMVIGMGAKSWTLNQTGKAFSPGQPIILARAADPSIQMAGILLTHNPADGTCTGTMTSAQGAVGPHTDWIMSLGAAMLTGTADIVRDARSSNIALVQSDKGRLIEITSGSFTQTFGARAAGWHCIYSNTGSGDIGISTDGATYKVYTGEKRLLLYDGSTTYSIVLNAYSKIFAASDTWVKAPGYIAHSGEVDGAGGSGRRGATSTARGGGTGGARSPFRFPSSRLSATEAIVVGAPGAAITTDSTDGAPGGNSSFKNVVSEGGGGGSTFGNGQRGGHAFLSTAGNNNPTRAGADISQTSSDERTRTDAFFGGGGNSFIGNYGGTVHGASAGDSIDASNVLRPAIQSVFGGAGGAGNAAGTVVTPGGGPGAGGAASTNGTNSGAGIRGEVRIWGEI